MRQNNTLTAETEEDGTLTPQPITEVPSTRWWVYVICSYVGLFMSRHKTSHIIKFYVMTSYVMTITTSLHLVQTLGN